MFRKNVSGQYVGFVAVSSLSGTAMTLMSGQFSGYRCIDGGTPAALGGTIQEASGGLYVLNLFAADTNGNNISYLVLGASGMIPVEKTIVTMGTLTSGYFAVHISGQMSGQPITLLSGQSFLASGGVFLGSGSITSGLIASGVVWLASGSITSGVISSGVYVTVPPASVSGTWPASGANVVVPTSTISGTWPASGAFVVATPVSGQFSGQFVSLQPWLNLAVSVDQAQSGSNSGTIVLASGAIGLDNWYVGDAVYLYGGVWGSGQYRTITSYTASTRVAVVDRPWALSGVPASGTNYVLLAADNPATTSGLNVTASVLSGNLSGQPITLLSGQSFLASGGATLASGSVTSGVISSGVFVTATASIASGQVWLASGSITSGVISSGIFVTATASAPASGTTYLASGHSLFWSGFIYLESGQNVNIFSGQLSGFAVTPLSGYNFPASGVNAVVPPSSISGTWPASGANVVVPVATLSGVVANSGLNVIVPIASVSGINAVVPIVSVSGVNAVVPIVSVSGVNAVVPIATISGTNVVAGSILDKSGYTLTASGLDTITIETGMNMRQAQAVIAAAAAGRFSGAGTATVRIEGANVSGTLRIGPATVDASGNRTAVPLSLPT